MSRMGVIILTSGGNAVWYARIHEFAKVLAQTCDAEIAQGAPESQSRSFGPRLRRQFAQVAPGLLRPPLKAERFFEEAHDTLVVVASGVADLLLLPEMRLPKARKTVLVLFELWVKEIPQRLTVLKHSLKHFTHVVTGFESSLPECRRRLRRDFAHLPEAIDALEQLSLAPQFSKSVMPQVLSYGRIHAEQYAALRKGWLDGQIHYRFDSTAGTMAKVPLVDHRRKMREELACSDFVVANMAKFDEPKLTSHQKPEFGPRFLEAAAAGAIPVGDFSNADLQAECGLQGLAVPITSSGEMVERMCTMPLDERRAMQRENLCVALARHDWAHRALDLLGLIGESVPQPLFDRLAQLEQARERLLTNADTMDPLAACA